MKPIKNHHFCIGANRSKMLFESDKKAKNFIRFNAEEIEQQTGRAPIRSYYCHFCCGWHVTSLESEEIGRQISERDERMMQMLISKRQKGKEKEVAPRPSVTTRLTPDEIAQNFLNKFRNITIVEHEDVLADSNLQDLIARYDRIIGQKTGCIVDTKLRDDMMRYAERAKDLCALKKADMIYREIMQDWSQRSWFNLYLSVLTCATPDLMKELCREIRSVRNNLSYWQDKLNSPTWKKINVAFSSVEKVRSQRKKELNKCYKIEITPKPFKGISPSSKRYKTMLLALIDTLDDIRNGYNNGDTYHVWDLVEKGLRRLSLFAEDETVLKVKSHYSKWMDLLMAA